MKYNREFLIENEPNIYCKSLEERDSVKNILIINGFVYDSRFSRDESRMIVCVCNNNYFFFMISEISRVSIKAKDFISDYHNKNK